MNAHKATLPQGTEVGHCAICLRNAINLGRTIRHQPTPKAVLAARIAKAAK